MRVQDGKRVFFTNRKPTQYAYTTDCCRLDDLLPVEESLATLISSSFIKSPFPILIAGPFTPDFIE